MIERIDAFVSAVLSRFSMSPGVFHSIAPEGLLTDNAPELVAYAVVLHSLELKFQDITLSFFNFSGSHDY